MVASCGGSRTILESRDVAMMHSWAHRDAAGGWGIVDVEASGGKRIRVDAV